MLKIIITVRMTTNISDNISTHVVFRVVQLNIIRVKHSIKKYMQDERKNGRQETQEKNMVIKEERGRKREGEREGGRGRR